MALLLAFPIKQVQVMCHGRRKTEPWKRDLAGFSASSIRMSVAPCGNLGLDLDKRHNFTKLMPILRVIALAGKLH
jgi:hypothetical protein